MYITHTYKQTDIKKIFLLKHRELRLGLNVMLMYFYFYFFGCFNIKEKIYVH